ncbi:mycothiol transferase, partial [Streptomyces calidiresistens]|uniref:mycothiol transferase n=1 Tax=Streptomyces calidiresistens TaxID=1485586 RepID=UPI002B2143E0
CIIDRHTVLSPVWPDPEGLRPSPSRTGTEREPLVGSPEWHRKTFELRCSGLPAERLSERSVEPSRLSLHGLVRHPAGVERWWFRRQFPGEPVPDTCTGPIPVRRGPRAGHRGPER